MSRAVIEIFVTDPYTCNPPKSCIIGTLLAHSILLFYNDRKILCRNTLLLKNTRIRTNRRN